MEEDYIPRYQTVGSPIENADKQNVGYLKHEIKKNMMKELGKTEVASKKHEASTKFNTQYQDKTVQIEGSDHPLLSQSQSQNQNSEIRMSNASSPKEFIKTLTIDKRLDDEELPSPIKKSPESASRYFVNDIPGPMSSENESVKPKSNSPKSTLR